ncbi:MAG: hypothetical protein R6T96_15180 [Longimicrobiales bacterium]
MKGSRNPEAAFLAIMTAGATHEVRNVLAIIKESAGLIEDMVYLFEKKGKLDREKLHRAVDRIDTQVKRGADLLTSLNRLSHTLDSDTTPLELNEEVAQVGFLSQRFARKQGHQVSVRSLDKGLPLTLNQLHLHMALFSAMDLLLETLTEGATVEMRVVERGGVAAVEFQGTQGGESPPVGDFAEEGLAGVRTWVRAVGAEMQGLDDGFGLRILFPETTEA